MTRAVVLTKADRSIPSPAIEANTGYLDNGVWYTMAGTASEPPWADDVVSMDEIDDDQVDQVADSYDDGDDQWVSYMGTLCTTVPGPPPNWNANRVAFEATLTNPSGGIEVPQSWIDARSGYTDDEFKGWVAYVYEANGYTLDATGETLRDIYLAGPGA